MKQKFAIPGKLPGLNEYTEKCRTNARSGGRMKRDAQDRVCWAIRMAKLVRMDGKVDVRIHWVEPNMRRDKDNIRFACKFVLDALVEMKIIANDGWKNVGDISDTYSVNAQQPRVIVELEEK